MLKILKHMPKHLKDLSKEERNAVTDKIYNMTKSKGRLYKIINSEGGCRYPGGIEWRGQVKHNSKVYSCYGFIPRDTFTFFYMVDYWGPMRTIQGFGLAVGYEENPPRPKWASGNFGFHFFQKLCTIFTNV